ncbi:hypothetical protein AM455_11400 [Klebsiella pneumoniae]|nr:hypothetical protein AM455_11400 [Klebsiella pneumoniae]
MKGMTVIVLMWEEAAIKDDIIEYDIAFNIIYIMRTHVVVAKLRCPSLTKLDMSALQSHHSDSNNADVSLYHHLVCRLTRLV